ncbi:rhombosortase [Ferrimonas sp. SCSIO 43195]|uniref:rhombosortase n=1 Tax=Ferrimonas sp. SCSIO 43195 TaxID=2822844 RepID=UPI002075BAD8|nr:rhombosortase [Ferrimonas sp. SCSIO 43195]USD39298.1 rhombosortase [Ferrimonas sp. SCSIO 43195]
MIKDKWGWPSASQWSMPALLAILAVGLYLLPQFHDALIWSRPHLDHDQWWRLFTGHLLHSNGYHLLMNLGGMAVMLGLFQPHFRFSTILMLSLFCGLCISLGVYWWVDGTQRYVGLSAVLHSWFTYGAIQDWKNGSKLGPLLLIGVIAKVTWENVVGASGDLASLIQARVAVEAHLYGVLSALLFVGLMQLKRQPERSITS